MKNNKKSIVLIIISIILLLASAYAWFINGSKSNTIIEANVKSWDIDIGKEKEYKLDVGDIYPGMTTKTDSVTINNKGDFAAKLSYKFTDITLFGKQYTTDAGYDIEKIIEECPFDVKVEFSEDVIKSKGAVEFTATIEWEYEDKEDKNEITEKDKLDTEFGNKAANYTGEKSNVIIGLYIIAQQENNTNTEQTKTVNL